MSNWLKSRHRLSWITRLYLKSSPHQPCFETRCFISTETRRVFPLFKVPVYSRSVYKQHSTLTTLTDGEQHIYNAVLKGFPNATFIKVEDISGGCGAMYDVFIESAEFNGKKLIQQHMMVNKVLKSEIADMHGIRITTKQSSS